jgi:Spy/CpxP family protein refolding chaperone
MHKFSRLLILTAISSSALLLAQAPTNGGGRPGGYGQGQGQGQGQGVGQGIDRQGPPRDGEGPEGQRAARRPMKWWKDSSIVKQIGLSDAQVKQIEDTFHAHRLKLIDIIADVERQEATLEPLIEADNPDEKLVVAQIDKVAAARAQLEKENALMSLAIRKVLTPEQWKALRSLDVGLGMPHSGVRGGQRGGVGRGNMQGRRPPQGGPPQGDPLDNE